MKKLAGISIFLCCISILCASAAPAARRAPLPGYVIHFDCIATESEGRALVNIGKRAGAKVINVVPPAHIWENPQSVKMLDAILDEIHKCRLMFVFTRIDASYPPDQAGERFNYLYGRILTEPGRLPNGKPTTDYFLTTAGRDGYVEWMEEETRYYAKRFGQLPNLIGINLGPFSEPFSSERGGFLEFMFATQRYEISQYTPYAEKLWHGWQKKRFKEIAVANKEYGTAFASFDEVPLPLNESDTRFGKPLLAYFDFAACLNDWFEDCYERCRRIWHETSRRSNVPFILQFSGGEAEKFVKGNPCFAAFDLAGWVARADALGLSLYTNSGYPDMGHASVESTVNLFALGRDMGKDVFVLEGGCEAPNVVLNDAELQFYGRVARKLQPRTYIYEFLKDKFDEEYKSNPGKLVAADGRIRRPAFDALRKLFKDITSSYVPPETPVLYVRSIPSASRGSEALGILSCALYDLASKAPIRWVPPEAESILKPGIPVLNVDGSLAPPSEALSRLLHSIPPVDSRDREPWRQSVLAALGFKP